MNVNYGWMGCITKQNYALCQIFLRKEVGRGEEMGPHTQRNNPPPKPGVKLMKRLLLTAGSILLAAAAWAHTPAGVIYPAVQFPDANLPTIDGDISDWDVVNETYWITHEQLVETVQGLGTSWDATDLSVRVILGWNPTINRLYIMEDRFDDAIWVLTDWDSMEFEFDADHSGGRFGMFSDLVETQEEADRLHGAQAQNYGINNGGAGTMAWHKAQWHTMPPWGDWATSQSVPEGGEGFFYAETMITGWNDLDWNGPETSEVHQLKESEIVGFNFTMVDEDDVEDSGAYDGYWVLSGQTDSFREGDLLTDFLLAPIDPDINWADQQQATAVEEVGWGRLKATFAE